MVKYGELCERLQSLILQTMIDSNRRSVVGRNEAIIKPKICTFQCLLWCASMSSEKHPPFTLTRKSSSLDIPWHTGEIYILGKYKFSKSKTV